MTARQLGVAVGFLLAQTTFATYTVECYGRNRETGSRVDGECSDGYFAGRDSETRSPVRGDCAYGGDLEAHDVETGERVGGECDAGDNYLVSCTGYDSYTSAEVTGECSGGHFDGYDTETGSTVSGDCEFGGDLAAYNDETGEYVYGDCERE